LIIRRTASAVPKAIEMAAETTPNWVAALAIMSNPKIQAGYVRSLSKLRHQKMDLNENVVENVDYVVYR
jgi:hypothetical protein